MIKRTNVADSWAMFDSTREPVNPIDDLVYANSSAAESTNIYAAIDFTDTGFTVNGIGSTVNNAGGNYIYMAFADTADARFNFDASGNKNNWIANNINSNGESETTYDLMKDTPSLVDENAGNFAVINPLVGPSADTISEGNLKIATSLSYAAYSHTRATIGVSSGKWYWEVEWDATSASSAFASVGITTAVLNPYSQCIGQGAATVSYGYRNDAYKFSGGSITSYGASYTVGDVIGVALDLDAGTLAFYKNGAAQGTAYSSISGTYFPGISDVNNDAGRNSTFIANFGQRPFAYTPPSGFLKLNTFNLPDSTIEKGSDYFNTVLWTGANTNAGNSVTGVGFEPDFVWAKVRSQAYSPLLYDIIRGTGATAELSTDSTGAEGGTTSSERGYLNSFDTDGFSSVVGSNGDNLYFNQTSQTYVAWNWLASNTTASNTVGTIPSTVSVNTTSGFSIVNYTGNGLSNQTVGHSLSQDLAMLIVKSRTGGPFQWRTWHKSLSGPTYYVSLSSTVAQNTSSTVFNGQSSTTFTVGNDPSVNTSGYSVIAYCFAEVPGYSAFGKYTGNGSTAGPFIFTGFRPRLVIFKRTDSVSQWAIIDTERSPYNQTQRWLYPNAASAEDDASVLAIDFLSNGFKIRSPNVEVNASGGTHIYMAFAENPFKNANAR